VVGPTDPQEWEVLAKTNARRQRWIAEAGGQERGVIRWGYRRMADLRLSTTDPDASPMRSKKESASRLGYLTHYVVDGGKARVILDVLVTPAEEVTENLPMVELLFRSCLRWRLRPRSVTGDGAYGTKENIAAIEKAGIRAYTALPDHEKRTSLFGRETFTYDAEKTSIPAPGRALAPSQGYDHRERSVRYAARPSACNACAFKARCTKSTKGRWIRRSFDEEYLEKVSGPTARYGTLPQGHKETGPVWVEPLFGEAKDWHGSRRFRLSLIRRVALARYYSDFTTTF
jgi:hypothetical protein